MPAWLRALGAVKGDCPEQHHVLGVDGEIRSCPGLDEPRELHNRPSGRVEDHPLDVMGAAFDDVAVPGGDGYLRGGSHGPCLRLSRFGEVMV